tara:strand:+ start:467 stop:616 length:150 start_codon:yes stop_codon:yes gene_type:complete
LIIKIIALRRAKEKRLIIFLLEKLKWLSIFSKETFIFNSLFSNLKLSDH